ncbi:hypothetical protein BDP55DRAFT_639662 [Colletotrichum godetiae]|uniref:Uncharacterized protein n=1 Tax=Colletotrichum godetiae TaxID=1209918 RepID=A0AAJ0B375_9PEZI|nr:uncharacterized protein BDP55DRAFT_639662 [Colletotrichum godetiae]KAK1700824.1 hypothetical protein BDP55DRAFT_639662 [Colletotrichum godetiae]
MADAVITTTVTDTSQLLSDGACHLPSRALSHAGGCRCSISRFAGSSQRPANTCITRAQNR